MSAFGLGQALGIPTKEADRFINAYLDRYPGVRRYMEETPPSAETGGQGRDALRPGALAARHPEQEPDLRENARRMAINARIQGTAADLLKKAMIAIDRRLREEHPGRAAPPDRPRRAGPRGPRGEGREPWPPWSRRRWKASPSSRCRWSWTSGGGGAGTTRRRRGRLVVHAMTHNHSKQHKHQEIQLHAVDPSQGASFPTPASALSPTTSGDAPVTGRLAPGAGALGATPPVITVSTMPNILWPPNGTMRPVTISGTIGDTGSGVDPTSAAYSVGDEYGDVQPKGAITLEAGGRYSVTVLLPASRRGNDSDGRHYIVTVSAKDHAGNNASSASVVTVPHDKRH